MSSIFWAYDFGFFSSAISPRSLARNSFAYAIGDETTTLPHPIAYESVPLTIWFLSRFVQMYMSVARRHFVISSNVKYLL